MPGRANWFSEILYFMDYPENYTVFDCETSGTSPSRDLITQVGYCLVESRRVVASGSLMLDWTRTKNIEQDWLRERMATMKFEMEKKGSACHITYDRLAQEGADPLTVLAELNEMLTNTRESGRAFLAHNGWGFDVPFVHAHFMRHKLPFRFGPDDVYDTGAMEKANQLYAMPREHESQKDFCTRIRGRVIKGVYWALDRHCIPKYGLMEKHGLETAQAHDAGFDCLATHHLFECFRELSEEKEAAVAA